MDGVVQNETHVWTVDVRDETDTLPREADEYDAKVVTYAQYFNDANNNDRRTRTTAPSAADCNLSGDRQGDQTQWDFADITLTRDNNDLNGFSITSAAIPTAANDAEDTMVRVCVRATEASKEDTDVNGPWRIGGDTRVPKKTE